MNVSGNVMNMQHFQDFYYLEAMRAGLMMAKSAKPENAFRRSFDKLENDVQEAFDELSERMAKHIWIYLWGACLGEAIYAPGEGCSKYIPELKGFSYRNAFDYYPTNENIETVRNVFAQKGWSSSFGGRAWAQITEALFMYGNVPDAAFIDHTVDLEHNGGCVFNKTGEEPFYMDCMMDDYGGSNLKRFLDAKFSGNILNYDAQCYIPTRVSNKVYRLVTRYSNIVERVKAVEFLSPSLAWLMPFDVKFNPGAMERKYTLVDRYTSNDDDDDTPRNECRECGDHACHGCGLRIDGELYCTNCAMTCPNCDENVKKMDTTYIEGSDVTWCDDCAMNYTSTCDGCHETFSDDDLTTTDDDDELCDDCAQEHTCEFCGEIHFNELDEHIQEEHEDKLIERKQEETRKREGIEQLPLPLYNPIGSSMYKITYYWDTTYNNPVEFMVQGQLKHVLEQIETFKLAGAIVTNYVKMED